MSQTVTVPRHPLTPVEPTAQGSWAADAPVPPHADPAPRSWRARCSDDSGMSTAEYAVGTVAACGFAAVLYKAVTSDTVGRLLRGVIEQALSVSFV